MVNTIQPKSPNTAKQKLTSFFKESAGGYWIFGSAMYAMRRTSLRALQKPRKSEGKKMPPTKMMTNVGAGVRNGPCLGWSVRSFRFPLRDSYGKTGDRFLATGDEITVKSGRRARMKEVLPKRSVDQCLTRSLRPKV